MDKKRAQITIFIILGLVLLAVVSFAIYLRINVVEDRVGDLEQQVELSTQRTTLNLIVDGCLRTKAVQAIELYGVDESAEQLITNFIEYEILTCIDVSTFTNEGIRVYNEEGSVTTEVSDDAVVIELHLPLTLVKENSQVTLDDFAFTLQKVRHVTLPTDDNGRMQETYSFTTPNNRVEITIPENTIVKKDNTAVDSGELISLRLVDRNFMDMENTLSIGEIMYLMESGISFSPAATMTVYYDEDKLPPWEKEEELTLSIYNQNRGIWEVLPSIVEVDKNRIVAKIDHFSLFSITSSLCKHGVQNEQVIASGLIFKERCSPCESAALMTKGKYKDGLAFGEDAVYTASELGVEHEECDGACCYENDWDDDEPGKDETTSASSESECDDDGGNWNALTSTCTVHIDPTPRTLGYDLPEYVGGTAEWQFYVEKDGDSCESDESVEAPVTFEVFLSGEDTVDASLNGVPVMEGGDDLKNTAADIIGGWNTLSLVVKNTDSDGCAKAEVQVTVTGAGFLPKCGVGEITGTCVCGKQNIKHDSDKPLFCCESGVTVEDPTQCNPVNAVEFACPNGFLGSINHGCFCGGEAAWQYNHYGGQVHYCCGSSGLSAEACNFCGSGVISSGDEGCLCRGGVQASTGDVCCAVDSKTSFPLAPKDCPGYDSCGSSTPPLVSAVIRDITGSAIKASELCATTVSFSGGLKFLANLFCPTAQFSDDGKKTPIPYTENIACRSVVLFALPDNMDGFNNCAKIVGWDFDGDGIKEFNARECLKALIDEKEAAAKVSA